MNSVVFPKPPMLPASMIYFVFAGKKNMMTPYKYGLRKFQNAAIEITWGTGVQGGKIYGISVVTWDGEKLQRRLDLSSLQNSQYGITEAIREIKTKIKNENREKYGSITKSSDKQQE